MKFVHIADMHFDAPFVSLANRDFLAEERRLEQRKVFKDIVEYIKNNNIPYFFIAGDFYEQEYIKKSTIDYINNLFLEIPNTKVFITPGNHDPYINNSFYKQYNWANNVKIFTDSLEIVETNDANIYGYGFNDFHMKNKYENIKVEDNSKINILITHGNVDSTVEEYKEYNNLSSKKLNESGFDYIAIGHIHKKSYNDYLGQKIVYPGSTVSLGFDELNERGFILGEIKEDKSLKLEFIKVDQKEFREYELNIDEISSKEDLIQKLDAIKLDENFYKIVLVGKKSFEINTQDILKLISNKNILRIKDLAVFKYDIVEEAKKQTLKGLFAKSILDKINVAENKEEKEKLEKAFEVGMNVLN